jgi:hypothetical protein
MPPRDLQRLLAELLDGIDTAVVGVASGHLSADGFQAEMVRRLFEGQLAAYLVGSQGDTLSPQAERLIKDAVKAQLPYLDRFADEIAANGWREALAARAQLYAGSIKPTFWRARAFGLPLPYWPGDGSTPCLGNCRCSLRIDWLDEENLDADVYWHLGAEHHCGVCPQRAQDSPYRFRGGELQ